MDGILDEPSTHIDIIKKYYPHFYFKKAKNRERETHRPLRWFCFGVLWRAELGCVVMCGTVLCCVCAPRCCAVLCCAVLCCAVLCCAVLCGLYCALFCFSPILLCFALLCFALLCF